MSTYLEKVVSLDDFLVLIIIRALVCFVDCDTQRRKNQGSFRKLFGKLGIKVENLNDYPDLPEVALKLYDL